MTVRAPLVFLNGYAGILPAGDALAGTLASRQRQTLTGTAGQTQFTVTGGYSLIGTYPLLDVYINGVYITEYTATNGSTFTLADGLDSASDEVVVIPLVVNAVASQGSGGTSPSAKTYTLRGTSGLARRVSSYSDDTFAQMVGPSFSFMYSGSDVKESGFFVGSNSYITFGSGSSVYNSIGVTSPAYPKILVAAADRSYQNVYEGEPSDGVYVIRFEGNAGSADSGGSGHIWELSFYRDGSIILVTGSLNNSASVTLNDPTGLASAGSWLSQINGVNSNSAYLFTPNDAQGNGWSFTNKTGATS